MPYSGRPPWCRTVTTTGGPSNGVSYTSVAVPTLTSIFPNADPVADGTTVMLIGTNLAGAIVVSSGWHTGDVVHRRFRHADHRCRACRVGWNGAGHRHHSGRPEQRCGYTYVDVPTLLAGAPDLGPEAGGTTVVLIGTDLAGVTAVDFGAIPAALFTVGSNTQIAAVSPGISDWPPVPLEPGRCWCPSPCRAESNGVFCTHVPTPGV